MNKKGVQLSTQFVVSIILASVALGIGSFIIFSLFTEASDVVDHLSVHQQEELHQALTRQQTALLPSSIQARPGEQLVFGVGVFNRGETTTFSVQTEVLDDQGNQQSFAVISLPFSVTTNTSGTGLLLLTVPQHIQGTFLLTTQFCTTEDCIVPYAQKKKAFITVS